MIPTEEIKKHILFPKIRDFLGLKKEEKLPQKFEIGIGIVIPIKNKIFYIWAESKKLIDETMEIIAKLNFK